jgi:hypothetical protein
MESPHAFVQRKMQEEAAAKAKGEKPKESQEPTPELKELFPFANQKNWRRNPPQQQQQ